MTTTSGRARKFAVQIVSAVMLLLAVAGGLAAGSAANHRAASAQEADACTALCGSSGVGAIGLAGGPLAGVGAGAGSIGHVSAGG
jgi:hypothetical protein